MVSVVKAAALIYAGVGFEYIYPFHRPRRRSHRICAECHLVCNVAPCPPGEGCLAAIREG